MGDVGHAVLLQVLRGGGGSQHGRSRAVDLQQSTVVAEHQHPLRQSADHRAQSLIGVLQTAQPCLCSRRDRFQRRVRLTAVPGHLRQDPGATRGRLRVATPDRQQRRAGGGGQQHRASHDDRRAGATARGQTGRHSQRSDRRNAARNQRYPQSAARAPGPLAVFVTRAADVGRGDRFPDACRSLHEYYCVGS